MPALGQSVPHDSALEHVRGEAVFIDDMPALRGELVVDFVGSHDAHGTIIGIDIRAAKQVPGIVGVFTAADVAENRTGPVFHDEEVLASATVQFVGQPVVLIAGVNREP